MKFVKGNPAEYLAGLIIDHLNAGDKILWFLSGGSAIQIAVSVQNQLEDYDLSNLTVMLIDERYGPDGHSDSNWQQLQDAGFNFENLNAIPVLQGLPPKETTLKYQESLDRELKKADVRIGLLGIGADGHIAGILPGSSTLRETILATYYQAADYLRITATSAVITDLDEVIVSLHGESKREVAEGLQKRESIETMPAQMLRKVPRAIIFNDWIGENI